MWYNPLSYHIVSYFCKLLGTDINISYILIGILINVLTIIFFNIYINQYSNHFTAHFATLFTFIILPGLDPAGNSPSITYFGFPLHYGQLFFILYLFVLRKYSDKKNLLYAILAGLINGTLFLTHSAPFIIATLIFIVVNFYFLINSNLDKKYFIRNLLVFAILSTLISFYFLKTVFIDYKFKIYDDRPANFWPIYFSNIYNFLKCNLFLYPLLFLLIFSFILIDDKKIFRKKIIIEISVIFISLFLIFYLYIKRYLYDFFDYKLPNIVPILHFYFYLKFGIGLMIGHIFDKFVFIKEKIMVLIFSVFIFYFPIFNRKGDFKNEIFISEEKLEVLKFIEKETEINDVILTDQENEIFPLLASGRKTIIGNAYFSNPYINLEKRRIIAQNLYKNFLNNNLPNKTSDSLHLKYILLNKTNFNYQSLNYKPIFENKHEIMFKLPN
jgi:hypothetical protein